jgi:ketosteroid isomerase-like protein
MSSENVETLRAAMDAFNGRDGERLDALLTEDAEIVPVRAALEGTVYRGPDAGTQYCAAVEQSWEHLVWEVEQIREGDGWVLALGHIRGQGRDTGTPLDARAGWVARFRDGAIARFRTYPDRGGALEDVGLQG